MVDIEKYSKLSKTAYRSFIQAEWNNRLAMLLVLFVGILIVVTFLSQTIQLTFLPYKLSTKYVPQKTITKKIATTHSLTKWPLFGQSQIISMATRNVNLNLLGVLLDKDPKKSKAIIQIKKNEPKIYAAGEKVAGVKIYRIYNDRVMFRKNGKYEYIYLTWEGGPAPTNRRSPSILSSRKSKSQMSPEEYKKRIQQLRERFKLKTPKR